MKVFVAGSRQITSLDDYVIGKLKSICEKGYEVLIGDCYGVDALAQSVFYDLGYQRVTVYSALGHVRNNIGNWPVKGVPIPQGIYGYRLHQVKDIAMIRDANFGFMIWDGESRGTRYNIDRMMQQHKRTLVHIPDKQLTYLVLEEGQQALVRSKGDLQAE